MKSLLSRAFPDLDAAGIDALVTEADADGNDGVSEAEFVAFCSQHKEHKGVFRDALFGKSAEVGHFEKKKKGKKKKKSN